MTQIVLKINKMHDVLGTELTHLSGWFKANTLSVHLDIKKCMQFWKKIGYTFKLSID